MLSINLREQLDKKEQVNNATEDLIRDLLKSQASKALAALRLLQANKVSQQFITETLALKTRNCLNRMNRSLEAKSKASIYALVENRDMIVENESNRMKVQVAFISKLKSHRVVDLLVRAYQDKQRQSLAKMKFNRDTLSDTEGAKRKRLDALVMSLFNKTINKSEDAWSKLMTNNRQVQLKDQAKSIKRSAMIQALISNQKMKVKLSLLDILLQNRTASNEAKKITASKSMALKRLEVASKAKVDRAFRYLLSNELIRDKHDTEVKQRKSRVIQKLIDSHINKSKVAIKKIKNISDDARARQKKRDLIMGRLSHTLAIAQQAKVRETWQPLVKRSLLKSQTELSKNQKIRACLYFLRAAQLYKARQAREKLFKNGEFIKNRQDHSRSINLKAISTLISSLKQKVRLSYAYLKTRNDRQQVRETMTRGMTNKLIRLLAKQQHLKKRHALDRLVIDMVKGSADTDRAHSATEMAKLRRLSSIKKAMWRLVSKQTRKLGRSMAMMIEFSHRISKKDKVLKNFTKKLIANQRAKMNKSLAKMSHILLIGQADSDRRQTSIKSLARNIERATRDKKRLCFLNLASKSVTDNSRGLQLASIADRMAVKRISQALEAIRFAGILDDEKAQIAYITTLKVQEKTNVTHKLNTMLDKLLDSRLRAAWRDLNLKAQNKAKLEKLITRAYVRWLINRARGFDKLENWRIYTIGKERMLETIFEKANIRNRHMMKDIIGRLLDNITKSTLKQEKLAKVLQAGNLRAKSSQKDSFAKLKEFIKTLRSQQDAMLRATSMMGMLIGKQITKAYYSSLICQLRTSGKRSDKNKEFAGILGEMFKRRMREVVRSMLKYGRHMQYSKQEKTHIKDEALRTIVHLIGRNHTWAKGQYFEVLCAKPRMSDLSNILRALVRTRLYQSFSHMRLISNLDKRDRMIKLFNVLEINLAKAMKRRKRQTIDVIKAQFLNYNPWEKRIIKTWVFNTTQTLQHAFWRMRYVEDAGAGLVSVDKNIKLKRLAAMVKRIEQHGMAKCFDAVINYSDIRLLLETEINTGSQRLTMEAGETLQFQDLIKQYGMPRDRASTDNVFRVAKVSRISVQDKDNYRDDRRSNTTTFHSQITNSKAKIPQIETKVYDDWGTSSNKNASARFKEDEGHLDYYAKKHSTPNMMSSIEKSTSILKKPENMKFAKKSKPTENSAGANDSSVNMRVSPGYSVSFNEKALSVDLKSDKLKDEDAYAQNIYDRQQTLLKNKASPVQRAVGKEADDDREGNIRTMHDSEISEIGQFSPSSPQKTTYKQNNVHTLKGLEQLIAERETPLYQKSTVQITEPLENRTKMSSNGLLRKQNQKNSTVSKLNLNSKADSTFQDLDSGIQGPNSTSTKRSARPTKSQTQSELMSEITPKKSLKTLEDVLFRKK